MKVITVTLLALLGLANALPQQKDAVELVPESRQPRFVGDLVASQIEDLSKNIRDLGLDPFTNDGLSADLGLPVPVLFSAKVRALDVRATGLSNIVINNISFGLINLILTLDVSLPEIAVSLGDCGADLTILGSRFHGQGHGRLAIIEPRVSGTIRFRTGIISGGGLSVRDMNLDFNLGGLKFDGDIELFGLNITPVVSNVVNTLIPNRIAELKAEINQLVEIIALELVDIILG